MKHERLLEEERDMIKRGCETATKLLNWYAERMTSLEKRAALLEKGMVALVITFLAVTVVLEHPPLVCVCLFEMNSCLLSH